MMYRIFGFIGSLLVLAGSSYALVFEDHSQSTSNWDFLDYSGDSKIYTTQDHSCPPDYGHTVLHIEGDVVLGLAEGATLTEGTFIVLYKENLPRDKDADGVIMFWARYGQDTSVEHNTKLRRAHVWFEQDNDCGIQYRAIDTKDEESTIEERIGLGLVTDPWNRTNWIWQKVRIQGNVIRAKFWPAQQPEPQHWSLETTYDLKGERFGLRINSGSINVAYFAADARDIKRPAPRCYLFFPFARATQPRRIPLTLFTNADQATIETFEIVVSSEGRQLARTKFDARIPKGHGELSILLTSGRADADATIVALTRALPAGLCKVTVSSISGTFVAERAFEVVSVSKLRRRFDRAAAVIGQLGQTLKAADHYSEKVAALKVIQDAARAHLDHAIAQFEDGKVEESDMSLRFVTEALSELAGYKGQWLRTVAPLLRLTLLPRKFDDTRGIGQPKNGLCDFYATSYCLSFKPAELQAQSLVMGHSYELVIPWVVEGTTPDRDFNFRVRLVSPLGNRTVAASNAGPEVPTGQWQPGKVYRQRITLDVLAEDARRRPAQPLVLDEYHHLLVTVTDPKTGAKVILGNRPGKHPDRVGSSFQIKQLYVSSTPLEICGFTPVSSPVSEPRKDLVLVQNVGDKMLTADALFTVLTETNRVVFQQTQPISVPAGGKRRLTFNWTPTAAGNLTVRVRLMRHGVTLTEARCRVDIAPPPGYDFSVVKSPDVKRRGRTFITPLTINIGQSGPVPVKVQVFADGRLVGEAVKKAASVTVNAQPWFGYYDIHADLGDFSYDRRIIATIVQCKGSDVLVNGEPFIVKGVNVHGMDPSSPERTASMMRIMRELGFNAWRGDYPAPWQIDLAYELNTVYTVLAPFSVTSTTEIFGRQVGPPMATSRELTRLFVQRYRDSAGVLLWNSANEVVGENVDFVLSQLPVYQAFDAEKRPVHYANLYGQDLWQGQTAMGVNYYFGKGQVAADRHPLIERSVELASAHGIPALFCEYNSYHGAIHSTGVEAMDGLFSWGVEKAGMAGGFLYMKGNSTSHPGVFDPGFNTHKIFKEAIIKAFADARVELVSATGDTVKLRITNKRRCTLRQMLLSLAACGLRLDPIQLDDLAPQASVNVVIPLPQSLPGPTVTLKGKLQFVTHFGFRCEVPVSLIAGS